MTRQNILKYYGSKLDLKIDNSETYDFTLDKTGWIDIVLDFSEEYDFQLDNSREPSLPIIYESTVGSSVEYGCDYTILTQDEFSILTQNEECIQYQH
jgi:hypothetical protein